MAVRKNETPGEAEVSAPSSGGGNPFQNSLIFMALLFGLGFVANNYLIASQVAHDTTTEYKGYQEGVKDIR